MGAPLARFRFVPREVPLLTSDVAVDLLEALSSGRSHARTSLDLWIGEVTVKLEGETALIGGVVVTRSELEEVAKDDRTVFAVTDSGLLPVEVRSDRYYKLVNTGRGHAPTLEIDGIHMHRVAEVKPERDAAMKVALLGRLRGKRVLDTCTGLGYTAIEALKRGASEVVTVEVDPNVLSLAELNPWSRGLSDDRIKVLQGDVSELIRSFEDGSFDAVVHDPPRFSLAGELYGLEFYRELSRVLRRGGVVVHYVGKPGHLSGKRIHVGVMRRMREAGFSVRWVERVEAVVGLKVAG
ncbi:MAG: methyltransferase domain-containing protein [Aigarchaeota archaeon]|nr:methyltransferase domain-containing protein [Candidatus Calditenuis fumarioli]